MDKDFRSLMQAIEKIVASDHRIRDTLSSSKQVCIRTDQGIVGAMTLNASKQAD